MMMQLERKINFSAILVFFSISTILSVFWQIWYSPRKQKFMVWFPSDKPCRFLDSIAVLVRFLLMAWLVVAVGQEILETHISLLAETLVWCVGMQMQLLQWEQYHGQPLDPEVEGVGLTLHIALFFEKMVTTMMAKSLLDTSQLMFLVLPLQNYKHHIFQ